MEVPHDFPGFDQFLITRLLIAQHVIYTITTTCTIIFLKKTSQNVYMYIIKPNLSFKS